MAESVHRESPINEWFELSYAQFLTVPRLVMESMPHEWQERMAALLRELDDAIDWRPREGRYRRGSVAHLMKVLTPAAPEAGEERT